MSLYTLGNAKHFHDAVRHSAQLGSMVECHDLNGQTCICCAVSSSRCPPSGCSEATRAPRVAHHIGTAPAQVDLYLGFGGTPFRVPMFLEDDQTMSVIVEVIQMSCERVIADVVMSCNLKHNSPDSMEACWYSFCYARRWTLSRSLGAVTPSNLILSDHLISAEKVLVAFAAATPAS